jgi:hypothetical protein
MKPRLHFYRRREEQAGSFSLNRVEWRIYVLEHLKELNCALVDVNMCLGCGAACNWDLDVLSRPPITKRGSPPVLVLGGASKVYKPMLAGRCRCCVGKSTETGTTTTTGKMGSIGGSTGGTYNNTKWRHSRAHSHHAHSHHSHQPTHSQIN